MKIIYFLSLSLVLTIGAYGQGRIALDAKYAIDTNSSWNINELESKNFKPFEPDQRLNIGYNKNSAVWCLFKVKNIDRVKIDTWLSFDNIHIDSLVMYEQGKIVVILGDRTINSSPFLDVLALPINLNTGQEKTFLVLIKKEISALDFSYRLTDGIKLAKKSNLKIAVISFFIGIIFLLILFNALLLLISKKSVFLYYILYSILSAIYIVIATNYAKQLLFPQFLLYSEGRIYASSLWFIATSSFLSNYLNLRKFEPTKYRIVVAANVLNICIIVLSVILLILNELDTVKVIMLLGYVNFLLVILILLWSALLHMKINKAAATYILLSFIPQLMWGLCFILKFLGLIPNDIHTDWLVLVCLYEVLLFGYVLTKNYMDTFQINNTLIKEITLEKEKSLQAITQVQIRERRSIANIIHDNFGSKLAYILQLIHLKNISLAEENIKELASDIREISHRILPKSLDEGALISSLNSQVTTLNTGLKYAQIDLFTYDFPEKLDEIWIYDIYLIALEIINNALKHGNAQSVILELYGYPDSYVFQFSDDGKGFQSGGIIMGFGLENIEKRVKYYKGEFEISSTPGDGTVIQIVIPKNK
jgi:signal transduction histidine kinase